MKHQYHLLKLDRGDRKKIKEHMDKHLAPCMQTIYPEKVKQPHRPKLQDRPIPFNLMVARPVGRQEITDNPVAKAAMKKEWETLVKQKV